MTYPSLTTFPGVSLFPGTVTGSTAGAKVEVEFVAGTWTDVTADLDYAQGVTVTVGRSSPTQAPQTSSMSLSLRNPTGKYTPGLQVLSDLGVAPYYPNVIPRRRIRFSNTAGVRFLGFVQSWAPLLDNGVTGRCQVQAVDRMDQLSRVNMLPPIRQEIFTDRASMTRYWPMTDAAAPAVDASNNGAAIGLHIVGTGSTPTFGGNGPGFGDGTGVNFVPTASNAGRYLYARPVGTYTAAFGIWVNSANAGWGRQNVLWFDDGYDGVDANLYLSSGVPVFSLVGMGSIVGGASILDGGWHHLAVTSSGATVTLYVDGAAVGTAASGTSMWSATVQVGEASPESGRFAGNIGQLTMYAAPLSAARILAHYQAGMGWYGETVDARIARFLSYAGVSSTDRNLDVSSVIVNTYPQDGKDVLTACQDMVATEGAGSVFYVLAGSARFTNRNYRQPAAPVLTLDASLDTSRNNYQPSMDSQTLVNAVTADRMTSSGSQSTQTATDSASVALNGVYTGPSVSSYATTDGDVLRNAQQVVAANRTPGFRLPQVEVDLLSGANNLFAAVQSVQIGSPLRITNLPAGAAPATQIDVLVEGWVETAKIDAYSITYDTSPAGNPAIGVYGTARWQASGATLSASIDAFVTALAIVTPAGLPTFTTTAGSYPLNVVIGGEHITLNAAPGGSTSPQTFASVTRAVDGTFRSAHTAGVSVALSPTTTYAL